MDSILSQHLSLCRKFSALNYRTLKKENVIQTNKQVLRQEHVSESSHPFRKLLPTDQPTDGRKKIVHKEVSLPITYNPMEQVFINLFLLINLFLRFSKVFIIQLTTISRPRWLYNIIQTRFFMTQLILLTCGSYICVCTNICTCVCLFLVNEAYWECNFPMTPHVRWSVWLWMVNGSTAYVIFNKVKKLKTQMQTILLVELTSTMSEWVPINPKSQNFD